MIRPPKTVSIPAPEPDIPSVTALVSINLAVVINVFAYCSSLAK